MVDAGDAVTTAPVVVLRPVIGVHTKPVPPEAVRVELPPGHIAVGLAFTVIGAAGKTFNVTDAVELHPEAVEPVTV